jgi:hypothetical protein
MIKIENISTPTLMAYQQMLEMTNVHLKEGSDDLMTQHKQGNIGIVFRNEQSKKMEQRFYNNQELTSKIQTELDRRLKLAFGNKATSGTYIDRVFVMMNKEIKTHAELLKERKDIGVKTLEKHDKKKPVGKLDLSISKEKTKTKK